MALFGDKENKNDLSEDEKLCRYCYDTENKDLLISACKCKGSLEFVHFNCLRDWLTMSGTASCQVCGNEYDLELEMKPLLKWSYTEKVNLILERNKPYLITCIFSILSNIIIGSTIDEDNIINLSPMSHVKVIIFLLLVFHKEICRAYRILKYHNLKIIRISGHAEDE